jgi:CheY-like chemotaxis protein
MKAIDNVTVLFVEDEPLTRVFMSKSLKKKVKDVFLAKNGKEALEKVAENAPDIIITDINMPVMDGKEMISYIRQSGNEVPIIVLTAYEHTAEELKASIVVRKPYVINNIVRHIGNLAEGIC